MVKVEDRNKFVFRRVRRYVSMIGIRSDEPKRILRIQTEKSCEEGHYYKDREISCMPLVDWGKSEHHVLNFWKRQPWDLDLDPKSETGNCVFCFLKGTKKLIRIREAMKKQGNMEQTKPMSLDWWSEMENKYGRDYVKEGRKVRDEKAKFVGFFEIDSGLTYERLKTMKEGEKVPKVEAEQSCDCTD